MPTSFEIGQNIKALRQKKNLSQKELGEAVGVNSTAITNYESGIRVPKDSIKMKIATVLEDSVENIFYREHSST